MNDDKSAFKDIFHCMDKLVYFESAYFTDSQILFAFSLAYNILRLILTNSIVFHWITNIEVAAPLKYGLS